ncbi:MAG TPA: serine hydrolase domain-containing protein, partial [Polyangiaceae bacterium]
VEIRKRFLDPLQLTNTYYELNEPARGELAHGYERLAWFSLDTYDWTPITGGSMGMVSTVSDLAAFIRIVGNRIQLSGSKNSEFPAYGDDWGVTWQRADHNANPLSVASAFFEHDGTSIFWGHGGAVPGYLSFAWRDPKNDITIVWFGSSTLGRDRSASGRFVRVLERALFDLALEQTGGDLENSSRAVTK